MATEHQIEVSGIPVLVVRKDIKHLHLAVYPPDGRVRVSAPSRTPDETVRLAVVGRLDWIRKRQRVLENQPRQSARELVTGECHYVAGRPCRLRLVERDEPPRVSLRNSKTLELQVRPGAKQQKRAEVLREWYREQLRRQIPDLLEKWQPIVGEEVADWGIKRMRTRWGTCNIDARRIWLNLELAKKPPTCLEYVLVHELVHLLERLHNDRFREYMDRFLPNWRLARDELNRAPLAHEDWGY